MRSDAARNPGGIGARGEDCYIKRTGVFVENFEKSH